MDEADSPIATESDPEPAARRGNRRWVSWIVARNPFYLLSAALLLFGVNRLSIDPSFISGEESNLVFNFCSLEIYELLLVVVAVFLARRSIWYDSTLLVVIENGLVLVPCLLITHGTLIGREVALPFTITVAIAVLGRWTVIWRRWGPLQRRLFVFGAVVLAFNLGLPFFYRARVEKFTEDWLEPGRFCWLVILPLFVACGNLLRRNNEWSTEPHRHPRLPLLILSLWAAATAVHLRAMDYIANLPFQLSLLAPAVWVACWTVHHRLHDLTIAPSQTLRATVLILPALVPLLGYQPGYMWLALCGANILVYLAIYARRRSRLAANMILVSAALMLAGAPEFLSRAFFGDFDRARFVLTAGGFYVVMRALVSRSPVLGFVGALAIAALPVFFLNKYPFVHLAIQAGGAFLLLHSFRWNQPIPQDASQLRTLVCIVWTFDSVVWTWTDPTAFRVVTVVSLMVLFIGVLAQWIAGCRISRVVVAGASISLLATPANYLVDKIRTSPTGLLAVVGSFLLFGLGTAAALTRSSWNHSASRIDK
jgi:hypothetical protein